MTPKLFLLRITKSNSGCWIFAGSKRDGYPRFREMKDGKLVNIQASHWAYRNYKGEITNGMCVLHTCDNRECVRPSHLFLGTRGDNHRDMVKKGRAAVGIKNGQSKLTEEQVLTIRKFAATGESYPKIAKRMGLRFGTVYDAATGAQWKHLPGAVGFCRQRGRKKIVIG